MTILMIRNAYRYDFGGGERFPVDNSVVLKDLGYDTVVVSSSPKLLAYANEQGIKSVKGIWWSRQNWGGWRTILLPIYLLWQLVLFFWYIGLLLRTKPDVVHIQSRDDFIAGTLASRFLGKRVVWTDHADLKYIYANYPIWYKNLIGKLVFGCSKLAHCVSMVSKSEQKLVTAALGKSLPSNHKVIYNGVSSKPIKKVSRPTNAQKDIIFACSSRLVVTKGIGELIEAFILAQKTLPETRLYLFGEGPDENKFKLLANDNRRIEFKGFPDNALAQIADCDVFVHPSYHEGFSISLVEATKLGLPVIACDVGGNSEIIRNNVNGLLVPSKDAEALSKAMTNLAANKQLRAKLSKASEETYKRDFILEDIIKEQFLPIYEGPK